MNKLTIIGNACSDAQARVTQSGVNVCSFTVAVNNRKKKQDGQNDTTFFKVSAWRGLSDICSKFVKKGMKVCVVGSVSVQTYSTNNGETRADLCVTADDVEFLSRVDGESNYQTKQDAVPESAPQAPACIDVTDDMGDLPF